MATEKPALEKTGKKRKREPAVATTLPVVVDCEASGNEGGKAVVTNDGKADKETEAGGAESSSSDDDDEDGCTSRNRETLVTCLNKKVVLRWINSCRSQAELSWFSLFEHFDSYLFYTIDPKKWPEIEALGDWAFDSYDDEGEAERHLAREREITAVLSADGHAGRLPKELCALVSAFAPAEGDVFYASTHDMDGKWVDVFENCTSMPRARFDKIQRRWTAARTFHRSKLYDYRSRARAKAPPATSSSGSPGTAALLLLASLND